MSQCTVVKQIKNPSLRYFCPNLRGEFVIIKKMDDSEFLHVNHITVYTKEKDLELNPKQFCTLDTCHVVTSSIFAIWWKKSKGQSYWQGKAEVLGQTMDKIRENLMQNFSLPVSE